MAQPRLSSAPWCGALGSACCFSTKRQPASRRRPAIAFDGQTHRLNHIEGALDSGNGSRLLADGAAAQLVVDALHHFDSERYLLIAWCVMPTHVHVIVEPLADHSLGSIVKSWKAYSATQINRRLGRTGALWAPDYFDRFMRDDDQLSNTVAYVEANPVAARLVKSAEDWAFSSASERAAGVRV